MDRKRIEEIDSDFFDIHNWVRLNGAEMSLESTGDKTFTVSAGISKDGRAFLEFPNSNRAYKDDWGYRTNSMGKDGQWIGQYSIPTHNEYIKQKSAIV
jgi:hypothetical protein